MTRRNPSKGNCIFCGREMTKVGLARHLPTCTQRQEAIRAASPRQSTQLGLYHLQVHSGSRPEFWLHLEMKSSAELEYLDHYLRTIWLECCGHASRFSVGGWRGDEIPQTRRAHQVFRSGMTLTHIYDFGTSSETLVRVLGKRQGKPLSRHPIFLMARNNPPEEDCMICGLPASWLCLECVYDKDKPGTLCSEHAEIHPHENYGEPMPLVNSPRVGICGYDGPAEAPY